MAVSPRENLLHESEKIGDTMVQETGSTRQPLEPLLVPKAAKSPEKFTGLFNDPEVASPIVPRNRFEGSVVDDLLYKPKPPMPEYTSLEEYRAQLQVKKPPSPQQVVWGGKRIWKDPENFKMPPLSGQQPVRYEPSFESITIASEEKVLGQIRQQALKDNKDFKSYVSNVEEFRNARKHISMFAREDLKEYLSEDVMALLTDVVFADCDKESVHTSQLQSEIDANARRILQFKPTQSNPASTQPRVTYTQYRKHDDTRRFMVKTLKESPVKLFNPRSVRLEAEGSSAIDRFIQEHQAVRESYKKKYTMGGDDGKEQEKQSNSETSPKASGVTGESQLDSPTKPPSTFSPQGRGWRWARPEDVRDMKWKIERDGVTNRKSTTVRLLKTSPLPLPRKQEAKDEGHDDSDEDTPAMRELRSSVNVAVPLIDIHPSTTVVLKDPEEVRKGSNALPSTTQTRAKGGGALVRVKQKPPPRRRLDETPVQAESVGFSRRPASRHESGRQRSNSIARRQKPVKYYQPEDTRRAKSSMSMSTAQGTSDGQSEHSVRDSAPYCREGKDDQKQAGTPAFASPKRRAKSVTPRTKHRQSTEPEQDSATPPIDEGSTFTEKAPIQSPLSSQMRSPLQPAPLQLKSPRASRGENSSAGQTPELSARYVNWDFPQAAPQSVGSFGNVRLTGTPVHMVEEQRSMDSVDMAMGREYSRQMVETFSQVLTTSSLSDTWELSVDIIQPEAPLERSFPTKKQKKVRM